MSDSSDQDQPAHPLAPLDAITAPRFAPVTLSKDLQFEITEFQLREAKSREEEAERRKTKRRGRGVPKSVWAMAEVPGQRWLVMVPEVGAFRVERTPEGFAIRAGEPRHYAASSLPVLGGSSPKKGKRAILLALYGEVTTAWHHLTGVRFKLLALIPAVSVVAWGTLLAADALDEGAGAVAGAVVAVLGAVLVSALRIYDLRNDELYDDLISRGRRIEEDLGVDTGLFRGRRTPAHPRVNHGIAVRMIYGTVGIGWLGLALWFVLQALDVIG